MGQHFTKLKLTELLFLLLILYSAYIIQLTVINYIVLDYKKWHRRSAVTSTAARSQTYNLQT